MEQDRQPIVIAAAELDDPQRRIGLNNIARTALGAPGIGEGGYKVATKDKPSPLEQAIEAGIIILKTDDVAHATPQPSIPKIRRMTGNGSFA